MNNDFHEKLTLLSIAWADAEAEAQKAELDAKQAFARKFLSAKGGRSIEAAKQMVESDPEYHQLEIQAIEARHKANLTKRAIKDAELSFERWRTMQANERFTARAAT